MKKIFIIAVMLFVFSATAYAAHGVVAFYNSSTDKIIIETSMGYTCGEVYGYYLGGKGNVVIGNLESYGIQEIYDTTYDTDFSMWVDEYWLSREDALAWLQEH